LGTFVFVGSGHVVSMFIIKGALLTIGYFYLTPAHTKYSERRIIHSGEMHGLS
jgi:hypothetical protein